MVIGDQAGRFGAQEFGTLLKYTLAAVNEEARAHDEIVIDLCWTGITRANNVYMRAGFHPFTFAELAPARR